MLQLMLPVAGQIVKLFVLILVGYIAVKLKAIPAETGGILSKLLLTISMPATIINSVLGSESSLPLKTILIFVLAGFAALAVSLAIGYIFPKYIYRAGKDAGVHAFLASQSNFAFMGIPVTLSVFGPEAAIYTSVIQIPANLLSYTIGIRLVAPKDTKLPLKKLLKNPACIAAFLAFFIYLTRIPVPALVLSSVELLAGITTPGAMLIIGMTLASFPLKGLFSDWRLYLTSVLRLIIIPAAAYFVLSFISDDRMFVSVVTLQLAMGSATISSMLAIQYGGNADLAGKGVFLTTVLSALTIPVWSIILK